MGAAAERWADLQRARGIPPEIRAQATADPWGFDATAFQAPATPADTPSRTAGLAALGAGGTVLDVFAADGVARPLWERFHGLRRPPPATADDAVAVVREVGIEPAVVRWERADPPRQDPVWVTRRLCLPADRAAEVDAALDALHRPRAAATLSWAP